MDPPLLSGRATGVTVGVAAAAAVMLFAEWRLRGLIADTAAAAARPIHAKTGGVETFAMSAAAATAIPLAPGCATLR